VASLVNLPPLALALLTRYGTVEVRQRLHGEPVGLFRGKDTPQAAEPLFADGLIKDGADRTFLTERGRELVRVLPIGKTRNAKPDWFDEAISPLMSTS
jgi:hypothetical protein